jgi:hypothetical protein
MEKGHFQFTDGLPFIEEAKNPVIGECSNDRGFDFLCCEYGQHLRKPVGRDCEYHPLLGLGNPDFIIPKTGILEGHLFQINNRPEFRAHFSHRTAKTTGAAVRHGGIETSTRIITGNQ